MDRRKLHKINGQTIGKNKQIAARTRANNRAAHQDAQRVMEEPEEVPVKVSRLERLKQWRLAKNEKKKEEEQFKKKPFVSAVKRGVFLDKTNYTELNKQRRRKVVAKKTNAEQTLPTRAQNVTAISINNVSRRGPKVTTDYDVVRSDNRDESAGLLAVPGDSSELNSTFDTVNADMAAVSSNTSVHFADAHSADTPVANVNMLTVPNVKSELNTTFEMENSIEKSGTLQTNNDEDQVAGAPGGTVDMLTVPGNTSVLNTTFEMENSIENNGKSEAGNQSSMGASNMVKADASVNMFTEEKSSIKFTPKSALNTSLNYVSPFVTIARGKGSAQKEVKVRESFYKLELSHSNRDSLAVRQNREAAEYFRFQVNKETTNLMEKIEYWTEYKDDNDHVDSVYVDQIDVPIGQTRLLINKKFKQFLGLCDECERGASRPPVLPKDLEGFWSMVFMQVENCGLRFQKLVTLKENDWVEVDLLPAKVTKQTRNRKVAKKGTVASSGIQKMIEEARLKMKENKITATAPSSSNSDVGHRFSMALRQTPARLSMSAVKTPRSIIKVKTPGVKRNMKSVAFSLIESPATSESPIAAATPKPRVIKRRASTSGIPTEKQTTTADGVSAFLTPNNRKISTGTATSTGRRSHRRLFSNAEK